MTATDLPGDDERALGRRLALTQPVARPYAAAAAAPLRGGLLPPRDRRFELAELLGRGSAGAVHAAFDRDLQREVAIKVLAQDGADAAELAAGFVAEARIAASLDHPNVVPVHEIDADGGSLSFVMKRVRGRSLGQVLADSAVGARAEPVRDANAVVNVVVAVANALGYAHHRGIVHQDVKPDNIMLGEYGEVLLADWGSAMRVGDERAVVYGTPLYMSPEQARGERPDPRSDLYCVGATLLHALLLRPPLSAAGGADRFWARKRAGEIDEPSPAERAAAPAPLLAIALKAMAADPTARYQRAEDLARDLLRFQEGLAVSAHRDSWRDTFARWHRRHGRAAWSTAAAATAIGVLAWLLVGERLKLRAEWGAPIVRGFDAQAGARWVPVRGSFRFDGDRAISTGEEIGILVLDRRLEGDVAVEYEAEVLPGAAPGDVSLVFGSDLIRDEHGNPINGLRDPNFLLVDTWDGTGCKILGDETQALAVSPRRLGPGRHRVRAEFLEDALPLRVDGDEICHATLDRFDRSGYLALYASYEGKAFGDLRVWARGLPRLAPATAIGDAFLRRAPPDADGACRHYQRVIDSSPSTALAEEATYKLGLAHDVAGRRADADAAWRRLRDPRWILRADGRRVRDACEAGDDDAADHWLDVLDAADHGAAAAAWVRGVTALLPHSVPDARRVRWVGMRRAGFDTTPIGRIAVARALLELGRYDEVADRYGDLLPEAPQALLASGRDAELLARYPDPISLACMALLRMGRFDEALARYPQLSKLSCEALIDAGRADEALTRFAGHPVLRGQALIALGRLDEAAADAGSWARVEALRLSGRPEQALAECGEWTRVPSLLALRRYDEIESSPHDPWERDWGRVGRLLGAHAGGDRSALAQLDAFQPQRELDDQPQFHADVLIPVLHALDGDAPGCRERLERVVAAHHDRACQRPWHFAALLTGRIDLAAFARQPYRATLAGDVALARAMAAELAGAPAAAAAAYAEFAAVPAWQRSIGCDPVIDDFVAWRRRALAAVR